MEAKLIVATGKSAGRAIVLKRPRLLIGRSEECDVRPLSEEVSRRHCQVLKETDHVAVEDLGSRNGTFVNGKKIEAKTILHDGDRLRVGSLELTIACVMPTVDRSEEDVSRWLMADDDVGSGLDTTHSIRMEDTASQNAADESHSSIDVGQDAIASETNPSDSASSDDSSLTRSGSLVDAIKESRSKPGTLPTKPNDDTDSSRDAAASALRKFFNNR
jgi:pSer/pThr/pTyr-binding forkhead associated (FHA) protein